MTPDEVRVRIRQDHEQISRRLERVEALVARVDKGEAGLVPQLRKRLKELGDVLLGHLHFEEYQWATLVPEQGGQGQGHSSLEVMEEEHQAQRELLARVIGELDEVAIGSALVVGVKELAHAIRDDMEHEERALSQHIP